MKLLKIAFSALALLLWPAAGIAEISGACKEHQGTEYKVDDFSGEETIAGDVGIRAGFSTGMALRVEVNGDDEVRLRLLYASSDWFFISDRLPLRSLSHGTVYEYPAITGMHQRDTYHVPNLGVQVKELQWFESNPEGVKALLSDPDTKLRVVGSNGYRDYGLKRRSHRRFVEWAQTCLPQEYLP